jgi:hypothetical protein
MVYMPLRLGTMLKIGVSYVSPLVEPSTLQETFVSVSLVVGALSILMATDTLLPAYTMLGTTRAT